MSNPAAGAVLDRELTTTAEGDISMADETPGMDETAPARYDNQSAGSDPKPESGTHSPDQAQNGQEGGGGTSDGDDGSS